MITSVKGALQKPDRLPEINLEWILQLVTASLSQQCFYFAVTERNPEAPTITGA